VGTTGRRERPDDQQPVSEPEDEYNFDFMDDNQFPVSLPLLSAPMPLQGKQRAPFQPLQDSKFRLLAWPDVVPSSDQDQEEIVLPFFHQPSKSGQVFSLHIST
jgi:hypothetical protein